MTKPAEPQAVSIPDETLTPCPHCKGVGSWAGTSPRGVCGQTITPCSYCAATGLRYPEERIAHLEAQLRDAEDTLQAARLAALQVNKLFAPPSPFYIKKLGPPITNYDQDIIDATFIELNRALARGPVQGEKP